MKQIIIEINFLLFIYIFYFESFVDCETEDECPPIFRGYTGPGNTGFIECISSVDECIQKQYNYYNSYELNCWKKGCPSGYYSNEKGINNLPSRDVSNNNCVKECGQSFPKRDSGGSICKKDCGDKYYTIDDPNTCINSCGALYPYISESNEKLCLKECQSDKFIIEQNDKKICISNCKTYNNSYFIAGDQKCYGKCPYSYNYIDDENFECFKSCLDNKNKPFSKEGKCVSSAGNDEYYYESDKIIRYTCNYYDWANSHLCHYQCPGNVEKFGNKYYCGCKFNTKIENNECVLECTHYYIQGQNQCIDNCPYKYVRYGKICYDAYCKEGQIFDEGQKRCIDKSSNTYKKLIIGDNNFEAYVKVSGCTGTDKFIKDSNDRECVSRCPEGNKYYTEGTQNVICKKDCGNEFYISKVNNEFLCKGNTCPTTYHTFYYVSNNSKDPIKLCSLSESPSYNYKLIDQTDNMARYSSCPTDYQYHIPENGFITCYRENPCSGINNYYFDGNCLTGQQCKDKNRLYIVGKECVDQCTKKKILKDNIYECSNNCDSEYKYIDSGDYCVNKCPESRNYISVSNYCKSQCGSSENYYEESNSGYKIYKCINVECKNNNKNTNYKFSGYNTHECFKECPSNLQYLAPGNKCYDNCLFDSTNSFTWESDKKCSSTCYNPNLYYYDKEKICKSECNDEDYAFKESDTKYQCIKDCSLKNKKSYIKKINNKINMCVDNCDGSKPYFNDGFCIDKCPDTKKFFIKKAVKQDLECLIDCPTGSPYYTIDSSDNILGCENSCNNYIIENYTDTKLNAKLCISKCDGSIAKYSDYKYFIEKDGKKYCYAICPYSQPFHIAGSGVKCLLDCSNAGNGLLYHEINDIICKSELSCNYQYIDFNAKLCLSQDQNQCPSYRAYTTKIKNKNKYICSDHCEYNSYRLSTPYNTCVENCGDINNKFKPNILNSFGSDCFCENLYYINDSIKVECFGINEQICKKVSEIYRIRMNDTKECVQTCSGSKVLSLWEDTCYKETYTCNEEIYKDTKLITKNNGQKKCDCKFRFYYITDDVSKDKRKVKKCMNETARCHDEGKSKYVPETLECVDECPYEFKFLFQNYFCLRNCPKDSVLKPNNICECVPPKKYWHKITSRTFECLDTCHDKYPVYAPSNNRCLNSCKNSYFPIFHQNKCYRTCNNSPMLNIVNAVNITEPKELYNIICKCEQETTWYRNESKTVICSGGLKDCKSFPDHAPFKYLVYDTWECVDECPEENPYFFNNYCFKKCSSAPSFLNIIYEGIFECQCINLWYNETSNNSKICINPNINECFLFNDKNLKYKINSTNECVEKCPDEMYVFNYVCYDKCPEYTEDNTKDKNCSCNTNTGYYYEYKRGDAIATVTFPNQFFECAVEECPENIKDKSKIDETRKYLLKEESKCLKSCKEDKKFSYYHICIYPCPNLTKLENDEICTFYDLTDLELENRTALKNATNVQAFKLYNESLTSNKNEFFFERYNVSIHIYGLDLNNSYKDIFFGSEKNKDLTYIDFSTCLNKLYLDKNISADEKIIIAKYDIRNGSYLINQIEYELFSNKTNERLDALVCSPYELIISYPLNLSKYNYINEGVVENDILRKFEYGKELYNQDNNINTFDFNSSIYKNFCRGVEIKGKDLVFEDRYSELYPNKMLLCENNCTINNTDFELERINCKCTYKGDFDYDRKEYVDDIFNNPNYYIPTQSPANVEVIKCLSNFTIMETIVHNAAFYYCTIVIAIELALVFISTIMGIDTITNFMKPILNKIQNQDFGKKPKEKKIRSIGFKEQNIISTTNGPLNNPPKRNNGLEDDDKKNNEDNLFETNDLDSNNDKPSDYEINIKKGSKDDNYKTSYNNNKYKAEFIPYEYNTKFFKQSDKGVIKKIDRSKLPFKVSSDIQYLVEKRKDIDYDKNYLDGAFYPSQNILIITDGANNNIEKIAKYIKYEKMSKNEKLNEKFKEKNKLFEKLNTNYSQYKEKDLITVKKIKPKFSNFDDRELSDEFDEDSDDMKIDEENAGLFTLIKREQLFLRLQYKKYLEKKHPNNLSIFIAEILDKIYIVKICIFLRKYDIFTHQLSLYVFCHLLLLSLLCGFFTIRVIKKIWRETNYPGAGFYILYGLISNIIIWIIYQIFLYILDFRDKIKEVVSLQKNLKEQEMYDFDDNIDERNEKIFKKKYALTVKRIKCIIFAYYITMFIIIVFCTIYLISFFALYTGTRKRVFKAYYLSLIIILIIKFIYGFCLASLRIASKINKMKTLYKVVYILDKYIS